MKREIFTLQGYIANHCTEVPISLVRKYQTALEENQTKHNKKRKVPQEQRYLDEYHNVTRSLPQERVDQIDRALIKFFVCCEVLFQVVELPFFIDLLKELNLIYNLPFWNILSNRLLKSKLGYVNLKVSKKLDSTNNLTIVFQFKNLKFFDFTLVYLIL